MNAWAQNVAEKVAIIQKRTEREWITAVDYADWCRYSQAQAAHILNRATEYGVLTKARLRDTDLNPALYPGRRFAWSVACEREVADGAFELQEEARRDFEMGLP